MPTIWTGDPQLSSPPSRRALTASAPADRADRVPAVILLARPARRRAPTAVVWHLLTYDRRTRTPVAEIARRWRPAGYGPDHEDGRNGAIPEPVTRWITAVLGPGATATAPAEDLAGPVSWHVSTASTASTAGGGE